MTARQIRELDVRPAHGRHKRGRRPCCTPPGGWLDLQITGFVRGSTVYQAETGGAGAAWVGDNGFRTVQHEVVQQDAGPALIPAALM